MLWRLLVLVLVLLTPAVVCGPMQQYCWVKGNKTSWSEAQQWCPKTSWDLLSLDLVSLDFLYNCTKSETLVWTSLRRDSLNDSVWFWDNDIVAAGTEDVSSRLSWTEEGSGGHCAFYNASSWFSGRCSEPLFFYCSSIDGEHEYVEKNMTWYEARDYCQRDQRTLSSPHQELWNQHTLSSPHQELWNQHTLSSPHQELWRKGWIGLYRVGGDTWAWVDGHQLNYPAWAPGEPLTSDCGAFNVEQQRFQSSPCEEPLEVACYRDRLKVVTQKKSWEGALQHCVEKGKTLVTLNDDNYEYVRKRIYRAHTDQVWVGVRFLGGRWWWLDGSPVEQQLYPECPQLSHGCGTISKYGNTTGLTQDCSRRLNFVCN